MHGVGGTISAGTGHNLVDVMEGETIGHQWGQKSGKYRAPLTDALSPPARHLYSDEEDQGSIFSAGISNTTLDTVALAGGPTSTVEGSQTDTESLKSPPSRAGPTKLLPPPLSPSQSSAGWGPHTDDDVQPLELDSPVGLKYQKTGAAAPEGEENEVATIRAVSSDEER